MGDITNFKINDDGSVTIDNLHENQENAILDIFRVENAKGGVFASCRMKKRALKYAKSANVPNHDLIVEKLLLESYPGCFRNVQLVFWMIVLFLLFVVFEAIATCMMCAYSTFDGGVVLACVGIIPLIYTIVIFRSILKNQSILTEQPHNTEQHEQIN